MTHCRMLPIRISEEPFHPLKVIRAASTVVQAQPQRGLDEARGGIHSILDSDDLLLPAKFSAQVATLQAGRECASATDPVAEGESCFQPNQDRDVPHEGHR